MLKPQRLLTAGRMDYAILCDRTAAEIVAWAESHPDCFVFPFATKSVAEAGDYSRVRSPNVAMACYVGNLSAPADAIRVIVENTVGSPANSVCVHDETPA